MIRHSRPKLSALYTLSQSKLLENHTLHSGTNLYSPYMAVPPPPFPFNVVLEADWHTTWGMDNWGDIRVKYYVVFALELSGSIETFGILTDQVLFVLDGLLLGSCTFTGCGDVFFNRKVKCQQLQVGGSREAYDCWAWGVCDIEGCSSVFPFVGTRYGNSTVVLDL